MTVEPESLRAVAVSVAREAADWLRSARPAGRIPVSATKSSPTDPVTAFDTAVQQLLRDRLHELRPEDGFVGEEGGDEPGGSGVVWVVDPIDGTVNFMYGLPAYAVSVAARVGTTVLAGCVINVVSAEEFSAARGLGATRRESAATEPTRLQVPTAPPLDQALVATGFSYDLDTRLRQAAAVGRLLSHVRDVRRFGAASLDLCAVAAGRVDAYVEQGLQPWDLAAGGLVAEEAGAVVLGVDGGAADQRLVLASVPGLAQPLAALVGRCGF
ncbi:MAG: inositol monophosphatase [Nocardioidaceae bacterium]|nr:inositol monophosphatase [Nocardioidaceae bacterium]MDQ3325661.1 inositol monophosphatase [Actinomycetota bacterium]